MRYPQVIVCAPDDWTANQLRPQAAERRWLVRSVRATSVARTLAMDPRPTVLVVQANPTADPPEALRLVAEVHQRRPDVAAVVIGDVKLNDDTRVAWAAAVYDLGARYVLTPPLTRAVLEDLIGGLMDVVCRAVGAEGGVAPVEVIDLAHEEYEEA